MSALHTPGTSKLIDDSAQASEFKGDSGQKQVQVNIENQEDNAPASPVVKSPMSQ